MNRPPFFLSLSKQATLLVAALVTVAVSGCDRSHSENAQVASPETNTAAAADSDTTVYRVRGVVRKVAEDHTMAVIDHEEIPDYMEAMSMPFYPREPKVFADLEPGQQIEFDYHVAGDRSWVENISVVPKSAVQIATEEEKTAN